MKIRIYYQVTLLLLFSLSATAQQSLSGTYKRVLIDGYETFKLTAIYNCYEVEYELVSSLGTKKISLGTTCEGEDGRYDVTFSEEKYYALWPGEWDYEKKVMLDISADDYGETNYQVIFYRLND